MAKAKTDMDNILQRIDAMREKEMLGPSSETLAQFLCFGVAPDEPTWPKDADAFSRCAALLLECPELEDRMGQMRDLPAPAGAIWDALALRWAEIKNAFETEAMELPEGAETKDYQETNMLLAAIIEPLENQPAKVVNLPRARTIGPHGEVPTDPTDTGQPNPPKKKGRGKGKKAAADDDGAGIGHNSSLDFTPGSKDAETLIGYCERLEKLAEDMEPIKEELKEVKADITGVYNEAKAYGFDKQTVKWLLARRKETKETQELLAKQRSDYAKAAGLQLQFVF